MTITEHDVSHLARLARIELKSENRPRIQNDLSRIVQLIAQLQAVDTAGIEPMAHPLEAHQGVSLRLRDDLAAPTGSLDQREALMANAPAQDQGLFLVPTVID